jgi:hypothetical protein
MLTQQFSIVSNKEKRSGHIKSQLLVDSPFRSLLTVKSKEIFVATFKQIKGVQVRIYFDEFCFIIQATFYRD